MDQQKYALTIKANDKALDPNVVTNDANFCVGQNISFSLDGVPAGVTATNFQWTLDGNYMNKRIPPANTNSSEIFTNEPALLKNSTIPYCWWTSGGFNPPKTYTATVTCDLIFTNGNALQKAEAQGLFSMHRPETYNYTLGSPPPGAGILNLRLITFPHAFFAVGIHSAFGGEASTTQLVNGYSTNNTIFDSTFGADELDNVEFVPFATTNGLVPIFAGADADGQNINNLTGIDDYPSIICDGSTVKHEAFTDYIRFQPSGENSIFVTLGIVHWHVYAAAVPSGTNYILSGTPDVNIDQSVTPSSQFPQWTNILHNTVAP